MNDPMQLTNGEFTLDVMPDGDTFTIAAPGLARALGFRDAYRLMESIPDSEKGYTLACTPGGEQRVGYLTETGFYRALGQRQPARIKDPDIRDRVTRFQNWVYAEVLPSIRRRGGYLTPDAAEQALTDPDFIIRLATELKTERARTAELEAAREADRPKVLFADAVTASHTDILIGELAKILRGNNIPVGQNRLFAWMRDNGFLISRKGTDWNMPTQRAMELGLFRIKETTVVHSDGHTSVSKTPKVTGKGQEYFISRFLDGRFTLDTGVPA